MSLVTSLKSRLLRKKKVTTTKFFEDEDDFVGIIRWIKYKYWKILPYEWRPGHIWYRLKGFFWYRYTTIKPRTLNYHTWCDRSILMPHMVFEILSQFIENECSPGQVLWYGEYGYKIEVGEAHVYVRDEMDELYNWWHQTYLKDYPAQNDAIWEEISKFQPEHLFEKCEDFDGYEHKPKFKKKGDKEMYRYLIGTSAELEGEMARGLERRLIRVMKLIPYMWT